MTSPAKRPLPPALPILTGDGYEQIYLLLASIFIASLVAGNLLFQKFFVFGIPLPGGGEYQFVQSVGILAYPLTFLVTDILSEVYGAKRANWVVTVGLVTSVFTVLLVEVSDATSAASFGTDDATFHAVFGLSKIAVFASMVAYLISQYIDIRLFHFWRRLTKGKHLWLRNNASTMTSQTLDTLVVLGLLTSFDVAGLTWADFPALFINGVLFKWLFALADTPVFYFAVGVLRRRFPEQCALLDEP